MALTASTDDNVRCFITGGCGLIGTSLISYFWRHFPASTVRVFDNLLVGTKEDLARAAAASDDPDATDYVPAGEDLPRVELICGEIKDVQSCLVLCREEKWLFILRPIPAWAVRLKSSGRPGGQHDRHLQHPGGCPPERDAAGRFRLQRCSGGRMRADPRRRLAHHPVCPYGANKLAGEGYSSAYCRSFRREMVSLRLGNVYESFSKQKSSLVVKFNRSTMYGLPLEICGDGSQNRDFIYIEDLVRAILTAAAADVAGEAFQIVTNAEKTVSQIA